MAPGGFQNLSLGLFSTEATLSRSYRVIFLVLLRQDLGAPWQEIGSFRGASSLLRLHAVCPGATQALIRGRSLRTIDVPHIGWLQLIDELSEGSSY